MTAFVPKVDEPKKEENADIKLGNTESNEERIEINISPEMDGEKIVNENDEGNIMNEENDGKMNENDGKMNENDERKIMTNKNEENASDDDLDKELKKWEIVAVSLIWFLCMTINNAEYEIWTKSTDNRVLIGMIQVALITLFSWLRVCSKCKDAIKNQLPISRLYYSRFIAPIALCIIAKLLIYTRFPWTSEIGETYSVTIEALLPVCMLVGSAIILGSDVSIKKIVLIGILTCLVSIFLWNFKPWRLDFQTSCAFAILLTLEMVFAKKVMQEKLLEPQQLLVQVGSLVLFFSLPVISYYFFICIYYNDLEEASFFLSPVDLLGCIIHSLLGWGQATATYKVLSMKSPFEFSVISIGIHLISSLLLSALYLNRPGYHRINYFQ